MQAVMIRCQGLFKCMAACQVLPWPHCRGTSNTITHATLCEAAKPPKPTPNSFHLVLLLLKGSQTFWRPLEDGQNFRPVDKAGKRFDRPGGGTGAGV